jgi:hypothetical protein
MYGAQPSNGTPGSRLGCADRPRGATRIVATRAWVVSFDHMSNHPAALGNPGTHGGSEASCGCLCTADGLDLGPYPV